MSVASASTVRANPRAASGSASNQTGAELLPATDTLWQDVYHAGTPVKKDAYIKITLRGSAPVVQFKEK